MGSGAPDRVNIPYLMQDTRVCQIDVKMTNKTATELERGKYETCYDVKRGVHNICVK